MTKPRQTIFGTLSASILTLWVFFSAKWILPIYVRLELVELVEGRGEGLQERGTNHTPTHRSISMPCTRSKECGARSGFVARESVHVFRGIWKGMKGQEGGKVGVKDWAYHNVAH